MSANGSASCWHSWPMKPPLTRWLLPFVPCLLVRRGLFSAIMPPPAAAAALHMSAAHLEHIKALRAEGIARLGRDPKLQHPKRVLQDVAVGPGAYIRYGSGAINPLSVQLMSQQPQAYCLWIDIVTWNQLRCHQQLLLRLVLSELVISIVNCRCNYVLLLLPKTSSTGKAWQQPQQL